MGWVNSPHYFCAATETVADIANTKLKHQTSYPIHRLDDVSKSHPPSADPVADPTPAASAPDVSNQQHADPVACTTPAAPAPDVASTCTPTYTIKPLAIHDLYMDDFISLVQGNAKRRKQVKRSLLHSLDEVFRALAPGDNPNRQEPASVKKLLKGDGRWAMRKVVLGWVLDTVAKRIELPPHRIARLHDLLHSITPSHKHVSTKHWHQLLGELRSMTLGLPGAQGLFSTLQECFRHPVKSHRLTAHDFLTDFKVLAATADTRPTRINELLPQEPSTLGCTDAAAPGMGGIAFAPRPDGSLQPFLWRSRFQDAIINRLGTSSNRGSDITNSDLELAGSVAQHDVIAQHFDIRGHTLHNFHDNTSAVW
jgi:hypothetical protein